MSHILLVEDDLNLAMNLKRQLITEGYRITHVTRLSEIPHDISTFSLLIMDWMLPDGQGLDQVKKIRRTNDQTAIILLTAKVDLVDKVLGLESGANDYVTKPFEPRELFARIRVQLRQNELKHKAPGNFQFEDININYSTRVVLKGNLPIELTRKEFDLLVLLLNQKGKVFSREELLNQIWGFETFPTTRTVDTHILQLRQKLGDHIIETVRGIGYRFKHN